MNRRNFLKIAGGAGLIMAAGATFVSTRTLDTAIKPWQQAGSLYKEPLQRALSFALLAPNPHNRQPWQIDLISNTEGLLLCDLERRLPETDPFDRQIVIGLGCFLELFSLAARAEGFEASIDLFPEGAPAGDEDGRLDQRPIAHLKLTPNADLKPDPLFDHVMDRRTNRGGYDITRPVPDAARKDLISAGMVPFEGLVSGSVGLVTEEAELKIMRAITREGMVVEANNHDTHMESVNLMRLGVREVDQNPDGISLYGPMLDSLKLVGLLDREGLADPSSTAFKSGFDPMLEAADSSPAYVWILTRNNDRFSQIAAGRSYIRTNLAATANGLSMQPMSQVLQEYADMKALFDHVHAELTPDGTSRVQMLARIGYGPATNAAPRWPLDSRIIA